MRVVLLTRVRHGVLSGPESLTERWREASLVLFHCSCDVCRTSWDEHSLSTDACCHDRQAGHASVPTRSGQLFTPKLTPRRQESKTSIGQGGTLRQSLAALPFGASMVCRHMRLALPTPVFDLGTPWRSAPSCRYRIPMRPSHTYLGHLSADVQRLRGTWPRVHNSFAASHSVL